LSGDESGSESEESVEEAPKLPESVKTITGVSYRPEKRCFVASWYKGTKKFQQAFYIKNYHSLEATKKAAEKARIDAVGNPTDESIRSEPPPPPAPTVDPKPAPALPAEDTAAEISFDKENKSFRVQWRKGGVEHEKIFTVSGHGSTDAAREAAQNLLNARIARNPEGVTVTRYSDRKPTLTPPAPQEMAEVEIEAGITFDPVTKTYKLTLVGPKGKDVGYYPVKDYISQESALEAVRALKESLIERTN
jgi:hypothetical protein